MKWTWPAWRLVATQKATFTEVTEKMSLTDILQLYDAIEALEDAENRAYKKHEQKSKEKK